MGISGLNILLKKLIPKHQETKKLTYYKGSVIGIDTSIYLYKYIHAGIKNDSPKNTYIVNFINKIILYLNNGILPVFCFDGVPPTEKEHVLKKRHDNKEKLKKRIEDATKAGDYNTVQKLKKQLLYVSREQKKQLYMLFDTINIPYIQAEGEAEELCAYLQKKDIINFTLTEDTDSLVFGCNRVLRSTNDKNTVKEYNLIDILYSLKITYSQFIDICILSGCDYCPSIYKLGPINSYNLIKENGTIENSMDTICKKYNVPEDFNYKRARQLFTENKNQNSERILSKITSKRLIECYEENKIINFLNNLDFSYKYSNIICNRLKNAIENYNYLSKS